jgi:hypothetical protein
MVTYFISADHESIICLRCGEKSYNANDVAQRYCGNCKIFHDDFERDRMPDSAFQSMVQPMKSDDINLTLDDKLVLLIEECSEIIKAATKCLRFGYTRNQPGYGINDEVLAQEIGDLLGVVDALPLDQDLIKMCRDRKIAKAMWAKKLYGVKQP